MKNNVKCPVSIVFQDNCVEDIWFDCDLIQSNPVSVNTYDFGKAYELKGFGNMILTLDYFAIPSELGETPGVRIYNYIQLKKLNLI